MENRIGVLHLAWTLISGSQLTRNAKPSTTSLNNLTSSSKPSKSTPRFSSRFILPPLCLRFLNALIRSALGNWPRLSESAIPPADRSGRAGCGSWERVRRNVSRLPAVANIIKTCRAEMGGANLASGKVYWYLRGEARRVNPSVMIRDDVWMAQRFQ